MKVRKCETIDSAILTVFASNDSVANITIDGGATGNFILKGVAEFLGLKIVKATQRAVQADGHSPLHVEDHPQPLPEVPLWVGYSLIITWWQQSRRTDA